MKLLTIILFQIVCLSAYVLAQVKSATLDITSCSGEISRTGAITYSLRTELWVSNGYHDVMNFVIAGVGRKTEACSKDDMYCISDWNNIKNPTSIQMTMDNIKKPLTVTNKNIKMGDVCSSDQGNSQQCFFEMW